MLSHEYILILSVRCARGAALEILYALIFIQQFTGGLALFLICASCLMSVLADGGQGSFLFVLCVHLK